MSNDTTPTTGMIALRVPHSVTRGWGLTMSDSKIPHMTFGYMPAVTRTQLQALVPVVARVCEDTPPVVITLQGQDLYGPEKDTQVALVQMSPELRLFRTRVVTAALSLFPDIIDITTYPVWSPHVTYGKGDVDINTDCVFTADTLVLSLKHKEEHDLKLRGSAYR